MEKTIYDYNELSRHFYINQAGELLWKTNRLKRLVNSPAGTKSKRNQIIITLKKSRLQAKHVAWVLHYKEDPPAGLCIIHKNENRRDFRKENLKLVSMFEIAHGPRKLNSNNTSGIRGISSCGRDGKWRAYFSIRGKQFQLGEFTSKEEAIKARDAEEAKFLAKYGELHQ